MGEAGREGWGAMAAELPEVIAKLREDLSAAMADADGQRLQFELGPIEITLSVTVTSAGTGKAGVRFWVVDAGIDSSLSKAADQQIKLTLIPADTHAPLKADGTRWKPYVAGDAVPGES